MHHKGILVRNSVTSIIQRNSFSFNDANTHKFE